MKRGAAKAIVGEVRDTVSNWPQYADEVGIPEKADMEIGEANRLDLK